MEVYLEYKDDNERIHRYNLKPVEGFKIIIGRSPTSNLRLHSRMVGRNHGRVTFENEAFVYYDMGSVNGSVINNKKVSQHILQDGDVLRLGDRKLTFHSDMKTNAMPKLPKPRTQTNASPPPRTVQPPVGGLSAQVPMLKNENDALRKRCNDLAKKLKQSSEELERVQAQRDSLQQQVEQFEKEAKKYRDKDVAYSVDLHNLVDRNKDLAEKLKFQQGLLEQAREDLQNIQAKNNSLEVTAKEAQEQAEMMRDKLTEYKQQIEDFKVKMTQAQREIDQIQRDNDIKEYDIRTIKEENEILREKAATLEKNLREQNKKVRDFEVIIEENRRHIEELRRQIRQKNDEIDALHARLQDGGSGGVEAELREAVTDKEQQIEEFRERITELAGKVSAMEQEKQDLIAKIEDLQGNLDQARQTPSDISDHPEYKDKLRAVERLTGELRQLQATVDALKQEVKEADQRAAKSVENKVRQLEEENRILRERNEELKTNLAEQAPPAGNEGLRVYLEELEDTLIMLKDSLNESRAFLKALARTNTELSSDVFKGLGVESIQELEALMDDQIRLLDSDIKHLQKEYGG